MEEETLLVDKLYKLTRFIQILLVDKLLRSLINEKWDRALSDASSLVSLARDRFVLELEDQIVLDEQESREQKILTVRKVLKQILKEENNADLKMALDFLPRAE